MSSWSWITEAAVRSAWIFAAAMAVINLGRSVRAGFLNKINPTPANQAKVIGARKTSFIWLIATGVLGVIFVIALPYLSPGK